MNFHLSTSRYVSTTDWTRLSIFDYTSEGLSVPPYLFPVKLTSNFRYTSNELIFGFFPLYDTCNVLVDLFVKLMDLTSKF